MKLNFIVSCPDCGYIFITQSRKRTKCRKCGRTFKVSDNCLWRSTDYEVTLQKFYEIIGPAKWIRYNLKYID